MTIPTRVGLAMEFAVGLMLILLGVLSLTGFTQSITHRFAPPHNCIGSGVINFHEYIHNHSADIHKHLNQKPEGALQVALQRFGVYQLLRPLAVGLVHGLAGSAAVSLLVLTAIRDPRWAVGYLFVFGLGTIAGMMLFTMIIGVPFAYTGKRFTSFNCGLGFVSCLVSISFGLFIAFQVGFANGHFSEQPGWTPH